MLQPSFVRPPTYSTVCYNLKINFAGTSETSIFCEKNIKLHFLVYFNVNLSGNIRTGLTSTSSSKFFYVAFYQRLATTFSVARVTQSFSGSGSEMHTRLQLFEKSISKVSTPTLIFLNIMGKIDFCDLYLYNCRGKIVWST